MRILTPCYLLLLILVQSLSAQNKALEISGRLLNEKGNPISFASIFIAKDTLSKPLAGTVSDSLGVFRLKAGRPGRFTLWVRALAYKPYRRHISLESGVATDLGTLVLEPLAQRLSGVRISKRRPLVEQQLDRLVFHAEDFTGAAGGDALDVLQLTPRLLVSNGQVSIAGKRSVQLMIDGRMLSLSGAPLANYLRTIRAEEIKSVEVITTPPAKYDAEGQSGIVNLILKKPKENSWNSALQASYQQAEYALGRLSQAFNYRKDQLSLFSSISYSKGSHASDEISRIHYDHPTLLWHDEQVRRSRRAALSIRTGLDYDLNKAWRIGLQYSGSYRNPPLATDHTQTTLTDAQSNRTQLNTQGRDETRSDFNAINLHAIAKLDTIGRKLSLDVDLLKYKAHRNRHFDSETRGASTPVKLQLTIPAIGLLKIIPCGSMSNIRSKGSA